MVRNYRRCVTSRQHLPLRVPVGHYEEFGNVGLPWMRKGSTSAHNSRHGTTCSISSRNIARRVFLVYCSKPVIIARVLCFISQTLLPDQLSKAESLIRVSLGQQHVI